MTDNFIINVKERVVLMRETLILMFTFYATK